MQEKTDYYVYVHKRKDTGEVFYVGHGRTVRATQSGSGKTKQWTIVATDAGGYDIVKIKEGLSKSEAIDLEEFYIKNPEESWNLVNKRLPTRTNKTPIGFLKSKFYYDPSSPSSLRYKENSYKNKGALSKAAGDVAGGVLKTKDGKPLCWRLKVTFDNKKQALKVHRIVWMITNGEISDDLIVDHIDGNPLNNRIDNLRLVSQHLNTRNKRASRFSSTGIVGIILKNNSFSASLSVDSDNRKSKSFSINKYGADRALYLAVKARYDFIESIPEEFKYSREHVDTDKLIKIITDFESQGANGGVNILNI